MFFITVLYSCWPCSHDGVIVIVALLTLLVLFFEMLLMLKILLSCGCVAIDFPVENNLNLRVCLSWILAA